MYFIIQKQLVTNSITRNKKQPWLNINSNKLLQLKIKRSNYNCSFNHNKKKELINYCSLPSFLSSFCVCASCLVNYTFNYSFVYSLFERALLETFILFLACWIYFFLRNINFFLRNKRNNKFVLFND